MKNSWEWTEDDLVFLVDNNISEDLHLEFKACESLLWKGNGGKEDKQKVIEEISRDVSCFANADSGVIVYGIQEDRKDRTKAAYAIKLDDGFDSLITSKEWLDNVINSNISPKMDGLRINPIELKRTHPGKFAYVVYVPRALRQPYQAKDKCYYKRRNFSKDKMDHYEIMEVFNRETLPDVYALLGIGIHSHYDSVFHLKVNLCNRSNEPAYYAMIFLYIDSRITCLAGVPDQVFRPIDQNIVSINGKEYQSMIYQYNHHIASSVPIMREKSLPVFLHGLKIQKESIQPEEKYGIMIEVAVPRMGVFSEKYVLAIEDMKTLELVPAK